jgi:hypothetical protein
VADAFALAELASDHPFRDQYVLVYVASNVRAVVTRHPDQDVPARVYRPGEP